MKIKVKDRPVEEVLALPAIAHKTPARQNPLMRKLMAFLSVSELKKAGFSCDLSALDALPAGEPALYVMNHSSFIDLEIASVILKNRPFHIVCTLDGFVGKERLMRSLGCIPARKFITDVPLVRDMVHVTAKLKESVLLFPEASYSFDGTATPLPESLGKCIRMMKVPVVMIRTWGAFSRDPLYNGLRIRHVPVRAKAQILFTAEEAISLPPVEINRRLTETFTFDHFRWQQEKRVCIAEEFRATGLERVLYKCPVCGNERQMKGEGTEISCGFCGASWELTEYGALRNLKEGVPEKKDVKLPQRINHIPDWYRWERSCVRSQIDEGSFREEIPVRIMILADTDAVYRVGEGVLVHDADGFTLTGCDGKLHYTQPAAASYSLYADYFWYELGDMICIGDLQRQYYCFPLEKEYPVARERLAAEELFKAKTAS